MRAIITDWGGVLTNPEYDMPITMGEALRRFRASGIAVAILSNSPGTTYPDHLDHSYDDVVLSGQVELAKPDRQIYQLAVERLGFAAAECVFIDDVAGNVAAAVACGLVGIHHLTAHDTIEQLEAIFARTVIHDADWHDEN